MIKSKNLQITKKVFINLNKHIITKKYFYLLPTIIYGRKKLIEWNLLRRVYNIGFLNLEIKVCVYKKIFIENVDINKKNSSVLNRIFAEYGKKVVDPIACASFINENPHIVSIINNGNQRSPYFSKMIIGYFENCSFLVDR